MTEAFRIEDIDSSIRIRLFVYNFRKMIFRFKKCFLFMLISENEKEKLPKKASDLSDKGLFEKSVTSKFSDTAFKLN